MSNKKYYWLKLKEDFFRDKRIKKLRRIAGGDTYTVIYLKLQLLSLKNNGALIYEGIEPTLEEELALEIDEDIDNVKITVAFLRGNGLLDETEQDTFIMTETIRNIGSESASAARVRKHREQQKQKLLQCNAPVTISNTEIEKEKEQEKELNLDIKKEKKKIYGAYANVRLLDAEKEKLINEYGEIETNEAIEYLSEYIEYKGYKAKSHYLAIRKWVINAVKEYKLKQLELQKKEQQAQYITKATEIKPKDLSGVLYNWLDAD